MKFKEKVKQRRLELGLTLEDVAKVVGVSAPTIQRYESGEIKAVRTDKIKSLAQALKVTSSYLMDLEDDPKRSDAFSYFTEMQMGLLGYTVIFDEEDAFVVLKGPEGEFEIDEQSIQDLTNSMKSYLSFKIHELMQNSRRFGNGKR